MAFSDMLKKGIGIAGGIASGQGSSASLGNAGPATSGSSSDTFNFSTGGGSGGPFAQPQNNSVQMMVMGALVVGLGVLLLKRK